MLVSRPARAVRAALVTGSVAALLALSAGTAAAAPPAAFTLSPTSLSFGSVTVLQTTVLSVTVDTGRKAAVLDVDTLTGVFTDTLTGTCFQTWGYQVPANTSCTIDVQFRPLVAGTVSGTLVVDACMKWRPDVNNPLLAACDRVKDEQTASLDGTGLDLP
jgi:hypothetical protein